MATQLILIWTNAQTSPKVTSSSFSTSTQQTHNFTPGLFRSTVGFLGITTRKETPLGVIT